ncbi:MAG: hypothetical protein GX088_01310 [Clostridia bacterium]|nr:hypothetical protein [Clostridia bacterium]
MKILIAYYSKTGNTQFVAEKLAEELSKENTVEVKKIELKKPLGIFKGSWEAIRGKEPEILDLGISPADYDMVCIGCPIWAFNPHPAFNSIVSQCGSLSGIKTAVFATHGGQKKNALGKMVERVKDKGAEKVLYADFMVEDKEKTARKIESFAINLLSGF